MIWFSHFLAFWAEILQTFSVLFWKNLDTKITFAINWPISTNYVELWSFTLGDAKSNRLLPKSEVFQKHNIQYIIFLWECWFLAKNIINFDPRLINSTTKPTLMNECIYKIEQILIWQFFFSFNLLIYNLYKFNQHSEFWNWHLWAKFRPHYFGLVNIPKQCPLVAVELDRRVPDFHG